MKLFSTLLLLTLQPVFIQGQTTSPGAAATSDADALFQAQSIKCEWGQGAMVSWNEGRPSLKQASWDAGIVFDSIDTQAGTARIIGNIGAGDISVVVTPVGLTFIEKTGVGGAELHDSV